MDKNTELILNKLEALDKKVDNGFNEIRTDIKKINNDVEKINNDIKVINNDISEIREIHDDTRKTVVLLEADIAPKVRVLYETRTDLHSRVDALETKVEKLKFGSEVIRLVEIIENKTKV